MTFPRSIVLLASVVLCVAFVLLTGYGLARHELRPVLWGLALLVAGAAVVFAQVRSGRRA